MFNPVFAITMLLFVIGNLALYLYIPYYMLTHQMFAMVGLFVGYQICELIWMQKNHPPMGSLELTKYIIEHSEPKYSIEFAIIAICSIVFYGDFILPFICLAKVASHRLNIEFLKMLPH